MLLLAKGHRVWWETWSGALAWWRSHFLFHRWFLTFSHRRHKTSTESRSSCLIRGNKLLVNSSLVYQKQTNQHGLDTVLGLPSFLCLRWLYILPLLELSFGFCVVGIQPGFITLNDTWKKAEVRANIRSFMLLVSAHKLGTNFDVMHHIIRSSSTIL